MWILFLGSLCVLFGFSLLGFSLSSFLNSFLTLLFGFFLWFLLGFYLGSVRVLFEFCLGALSLNSFWVLFGLSSVGSILDSFGFYAVPSDIK